MDLERISGHQIKNTPRTWATLYTPYSPIKKMLSEGVEVVDCWDIRGWFEGFAPEEAEVRKLRNTALLINVQPIEKETAEDVLRDLIQRLRPGDPGSSWRILVDRAKKVLEK